MQVGGFLQPELELRALTIHLHPHGSELAGEQVAASQQLSRHQAATAVLILCCCFGSTYSAGIRNILKMDAVLKKIRWPMSFHPSLGA